ncbi:hypothetical protein PVAG01_07987 [Phlyctema vagabunda]|uniref:Uncharacterized protein n=1 Tax=Phlyctema vagabunda TaxID=108571 RepID=A0ABR4PDZ4_9HELO
MHFSTTALIAATALTPAVLAACKEGARSCAWYGESPGCGSTSYGLGGWDGAQQLKEWTKFESVTGLYQKGWISSSCYHDYGASCVTGYKRLWCKSSPYLVDQDDLVLEVPAPGPRHPHKKEVVRVEIDLA